MTKAGALARVATVALALASAATAQDSQVLTPSEMRAASVALLEQGQVPQAVALADALLQRDPEDVTALIVLSRAATLAGDYEAARVAAARAYDAAGDDDTRFIAARLAAQAHAADQQDTRAQVWLRRARQYAPNAAAAESVAEDYRFLNRRNPLAVRLRFGIAPSNNINNGSIRETSQLFGLPFEFELSGAARALSGLEISAGVSAQYRLRIDNRSATFATANADVRTYRLSSEAQEQAPDADGSDFSDASLSLGLVHRQLLTDSLPPTTFRADLAQGWYGGDPYTRSLALGVTQRFDFGETDSLTAQLTWRQTDYLDDPDGLRPDTTSSLSLSWRHVFGSGDVLRLSGGYRVNDADDPNRDYQAVTGGVSYDLAEPVAGFRLGFDLNFEDRTYDFSRLAGGTRTDEIWTGAMTAEITQVEYFGFRPVARVEANRAESNVDLYDREGISLRFDLVSAF